MQLPRDLSILNQIEPNDRPDNLHRNLFAVGGPRSIINDDIKQQLEQDDLAAKQAGVSPEYRTAMINSGFAKARLNKNVWMPYQNIVERIINGDFESMPPLAHTLYAILVQRVNALSHSNAHYRDFTLFWTNALQIHKQRHNVPYIATRDVYPPLSIIFDGLQELRNIDKKPFRTELHGETVYLYRLSTIPKDPLKNSIYPMLDKAISGLSEQVRRKVKKAMYITSNFHLAMDAEALKNDEFFDMFDPTRWVSDPTNGQDENVVSLYPLASNLRLYFVKTSK